MKILLIDDNPFDRELLKRGLTPLFEDIRYVEVIDAQTFENALLVLDYELVFTDYQLKWTTGLDVLKRIRQSSASLPVIMVTDTGSEEIATEAMKNGLNDYVLKTHLTRLPIAVTECLQKSQLQQEHRDLEAQLQKAQRMESLGLLVSGIAHDFNNLLAAIMGYAQRGMQNISPEHTLYEQFQHIQDRAEQGARMTKQLLSFARGTPLDPEQLLVSQMFTSLSDFLQKLMGPTIELHIESALDLHSVYADRTQIEQVLVNLCLNARDAMPEGGQLTISARNIVIDPLSPLSQTDMLAGPYVLLTITDTGIGMDEQIQARLFEPFFTTKDIGVGTGLGLAVVYGIVKQHHGFIQVQSTPGKGTTFSLYLPSAEIIQEEKQDVLPPRQEPQGGSETILLLEDDVDIQLVMSEFLRDCGYRVLLANDGEEGLEIFRKHSSSIALVITDIMMPKMKGKDFQGYIRQHNPRTKVLVVSGYQEIDLKRRQLLDSQSAFLPKPFALDDLARKVRNILES
ncbi:MAG TPA: response regulator [Ktedonobacteraceae bacterium]|nr:response regulator [Ktedonobacteraceae bacterium]